MSKESNQDDRGLIYVATGRDRYLSEVEASVTSLRKHMPDLPVTVYSDTASERLAGLGVYQERIDNPSSSYLDKVVALQRSPYARTIFLDTDTWITAADRRPVPAPRSRAGSGSP